MCRSVVSPYGTTVFPMSRSRIASATQVLKASGGKCALCGVSKDERPIDVDHIIPRPRVGKTILENLQALCSKCNRAKRNLDDTDFRTSAPVSAAKDCPFCDPSALRPL